MGALYTYMQQVTLLLCDAKLEVINPATMISFINSARGQVAGDGQCIRAYATLPTAAATQQYAFSAIVTGNAGATQVGNVRMISARSGSDKFRVNAWPWEWFNQYYLMNTAIANARPTDWSQLGQGVNGTLFFYPVPDAIYTLDLDVVCYPIALVDDTTAEALPYPWTDCIQYFAAYLALLSSQTGARTVDADRMLKRYEEFRTRARQYSTSDVLPFQFEQSSPRVAPPSAGQEAS